MLSLVILSIGMLKRLHSSLFNHRISDEQKKVLYTWTPEQRTPPCIAKSTEREVDAKLLNDETRV